MITLRNCTLHPLDIQLEDGRILVLPVDGSPPTLEVVKEALQAIKLSAEVEVPLIRSALDSPRGLPDPKEGVILVVPVAAAEHPALAGRQDLVYPGEPLRDTQGNIVGCKGLCAGPGLHLKILKNRTGGTTRETAIRRPIGDAVVETPTRLTTSKTSSSRIPKSPPRQPDLP